VAQEEGALRLNGAPMRPVGEHRFVLTHDPYTEITFHKRGLTIEREGQRTDYQN
jgi:hypothetical protein